MRQYRTEKKEIKVIQGVAQEDFLEVNKRWGYFSNKDNQEDVFDLCENCYDELVASFKFKL